nr:ribonuclease H-like domain-containing protein [Tanacetum cinerariifolium]
MIPGSFPQRGGRVLWDCQGGLWWGKDSKAKRDRLVVQEVGQKWQEVVAGSGPTWLFDIDTLTKTMNYQPVTAGNQSNPSAGVQEQFDEENTREENVQQYVLFLVWSSGFTNPQNTDGDAAFEENEPEFEGRKPESEVNVSPSSKFEDFSDNSINEDNAAGTLVLAVGQIFTNSTNTFSVASPSNDVVSPTHGKSLYVDYSKLPDDLNMPELEDITYSDDEEDVGAEADFTNLETTIPVSPIPTTRVHKDHPVTQIISDLSLATQTRSMTRVAKDQGGLSQINNDDFRTCMFVCFLSQEEPKRVHQALKDPSWIEAMQEELFQFKMQKVWVLIDLPNGKRAIGFEDPDYPDKVYKVVKALYGLHQAPRAWYEIKRIFRYLKGKPHLGLWYPKDSSFNLVAYSDSDYVGASLDRKSTTGGCQFLGCRLISWQCKKQTAVATSSTKAEYVTYVAVKKVNDVMRLQALVDKKKVVITEATIRDALRLDDAEGVECLPNEEIFTDAKRTSWNEFSSSMASAIICLSTDTPLFEGMIVEQPVGEGAPEVNVEDFLLLVLLKRVKKLERKNKASKLKRLKKVGIAQRIETSDDTVMDDVSKQGRMIADMDADVDVTLKDIAKDVALDAEIEESADIQGRQAESQAQIYQIDLEHANKVLSMQDDEVEPAELQDVVEVVTTAKLITEVVTAASATITTVAPQLTTGVAPTLTTAPSAARKRKGVVIRDPEETTTPSIIIHSEAKSKDKGKGILVEEPKPLKKQAQIEQDEAYARELEAELNKNIDWDEVIDHVHRKQKEDNAVNRYQALKRKPQTEAQARKNMMIYIRNVAGFKMDYFKGMNYDDICLIFKKKFNSNVAFMLKTKEQIDEEESRALKRLNESQEDKASKKQKLDEEVEELRRHL